MFVKYRLTQQRKNISVKVMTLNVNFNLSNFIHTKPIDDSLVEKQNEIDSEFEDKNPPRQSEEGKTKYFQKT